MKRGALLLCTGVAMLAGCGPNAGRNTHPVHLVRPAPGSLSEVAQVGRAIFFDSTLSASGHMSCATCHDPRYAYGPPPALQRTMTDSDVVRAVPSLRYLSRTPDFSIGPDQADADAPAPAPSGSAITSRAAKTAGTAADPQALVPQGGLFWDGRASTLQEQAIGPLTNHDEMDNRTAAAASNRLRATSYAPTLQQLFGADLFVHAERAVDEAMFAVARFESEDSSFHPYDSKFDSYLEGHAELTPSESRGLKLFEDPARGNCAGCHPSRPAGERLPPLFTDHQYEALGVPRNHAVRSNRATDHYDLGLCGPVRQDLSGQTQYCGMFTTPSLRNVALRPAYFHNGVYTTLDAVLRFYALRTSDPDSLYFTAAGRPDRLFNDVPAAFAANVDTVDAPFIPKHGAEAALTLQERRDIVAFLRILTDGYRERADGSILQGRP